MLDGEISPRLLRFVQFYIMTLFGCLQTTVCGWFSPQTCQQRCGFFGIWTLHAGAIFCPLCNPCPCCEARVPPGVL